MSGSITISIVAPGALESNGKTSIPGHIWYTVTDSAGNSRSFGFEPQTQGSPFGTGTVTELDGQTYKNGVVFAQSAPLTNDQVQAALTYGNSIESLAKYNADPVNQNLSQLAVAGAANIDASLSNTNTNYNFLGGMFGVQGVFGNNCASFVNGMVNYVGQKTGVQIDSKISAFAIPETQAGNAAKILNEITQQNSGQTNTVTEKCGDNDEYTCTVTGVYSAPDANGNRTLLSDKWTSSDGSIGTDVYYAPGNYTSTVVHANNSGSVITFNNGVGTQSNTDSNGKLSSSVTINNNTDSEQSTLIDSIGTSVQDIRNLTSGGATQNDQLINTSSAGAVTDQVSGTGAQVNLSNASVTLANGANATITGSQLQLNVGANSQAVVNGTDLTIAGSSGAAVVANGNTRLIYDASGNPIVALNGAQAPSSGVSNGGIGFSETLSSGTSLSGQISQTGLVTAQKTDTSGNSVIENGQAAATPTAQQTSVNAADANATAAYLAQEAVNANQAAGGSGAMSDTQLQLAETITSDPGQVSQSNIFDSIYEAASVQYTQRAVLSEQFVSQAAASLGISVQGAGALLANGATVIETLAAINDATEHPSIRSVATAAFLALQTGVTFSADFKESLANALLGAPTSPESQAANLAQLDYLMGNLGTPLSVIAGIANPTPATVFAAANAVANQLNAGLAFPEATAIASAIGFVQNPTPTNAANTALWTAAVIEPEFIPVAIAVSAVETVVNFVSGGKPIVLDMTGNGINLTSVNQSSAYFDLNGDGKREHYGWTGAGNAFLVYDAKGDGNINSASNLSFVGDSPGARTDLEGLIAFDTNHDGKFDKNDAAWNNFKICKTPMGTASVKPANSKPSTRSGLPRSHSLQMGCGAISPVIQSMAKVYLRAPMAPLAPLPTLRWPLMVKSPPPRLLLKHPATRVLSATLRLWC